ncbi:glycosyl transferase [Bacteroidia bacterium]|nr:glycosyl transferase [Bacteroidia bacterium]
MYKGNSPSFLDEALRSTFEQTCPPTEVLLVLDGATTSEQQEVIKKYAAKFPSIFKTLLLAKNVGQGPALNAGLQHCSHELVARMDVDDIAKPHRFEKQVRLFEQNPQIDVAGSWVEEFYDTPDEIISIRKLPQTHNELWQYAAGRCPFNHPSVMFKRSKVLACGGYELFGLLDDYLLWMKMRAAGANFYNIQESLLYFRSTKDIYKRRGGVRYAIDECKLQWMFYRRGMIGLPTAIKNICIRFGVRVMPNRLRAFVYQKMLR